MDKGKKKSEIAYTAIFAIVVLVIGAISLSKLLHFYMGEETDYNSYSPNLGSKVETDIASFFFGKFELISVNGAIRNMLGQREMNGVVKLDNGNLIIPMKQETDEQIIKCADEIIKYAQFCEDSEKEFLFVMPFMKVDEDNKQLPEGIEDFSNENVDKLLERLQSADVDVLDLRKCLKKDGLDIYDYTYRTDHHWSTEGAFYAFVKITERIDQKTGVQVDPVVTDINNYDIIKYPGWHLGSYGQRVGRYYVKADDYDLIVPKYGVSFVHENGETHSFTEEAVNEWVFEKRKEQNAYTYDSALSCPQGVATTSKPLKILMVSDSYSNAIAPYFKLAYADYRYQYYPDGFDAGFVMKKDPDVVVMMPYASSAFGGAEFKE